MAKHTAENGIKRLVASHMVEYYHAGNRKIHRISEKVDDSNYDVVIQKNSNMIERELDKLRKSYSSLPLMDKIAKSRPIALICITTLDAIILKFTTGEVDREDRELKKITEGHLKELYKIITLDRDAVVVFSAIWEAVMKREIW